MKLKATTLIEGSHDTCSVSAMRAGRIYVGSITIAVDEIPEFLNALTVALSQAAKDIEANNVNEVPKEAIK